jgi:hypothetical protein
MKPEKTRVVTLREGVDFLGYRISREGLWPSEKAVKRFHERVRSLTLPHETRPPKEVVARVMPFVRGWTNYFRLCRPARVWEPGLWFLTRLRACFTKHRWAGKWQSEWPMHRLLELGVETPWSLLKKTSR